MTSSQLQQAFADVVLHPDDDLPRETYAEICSNSGDELRARLIRLQLEALQKRRVGASDAHTPALAAYALLDKYANEWAGPIRDRVRRVAFYRGFVEEICVDARQFLKEAEELYQLAPIRKLQITGLLPALDEFLDSSHLRRIVSLNVELQELGDVEVSKISKSPNLSNLIFLGLRGNNLTVAGVESLAASEMFPALKAVDFTMTPAASVSEEVSYDAMSPERVWAGPSAEALRIEAKYGRKTWLHTVEDHGYRIPLVFAEC